MVLFLLLISSFLPRQFLQCLLDFGVKQAAFFGQIGAVKELLEAVANPNAQDAEGCTPIFLDRKSVV